MTAVIRLGFLPLVDAALPILARELGFAEQEGLALDLVRDVSWANVRDRLAFRRFHDHRLEQERGRRCPDAPTAPSRSSRRAPGTPPVARRRG